MIRVLYVPCVSGTTSLQPTQQLHSWAARQRLIDWQCLPGSCVVLEALVRDGSQYLNDSSISSAVEKSLLHVALQLGRGPPTVSSCSAHISLVASARKLLLLHSPATSFTTTPGGRATSDEQLTFEDIFEIHKVSQTTLSAVLAHLPKAKQRRSGATGKKKPPALKTILKLARSVADSSVLTRISSGSGCTLGAPAEAGCGLRQAMHQLAAILVVVLGSMESMMHAVLQRQRNNPDWTRGGGSDWMLEVEQHDAELVTLARALSLPFQPEKWKSPASALKHEAGVVDSYALKHCNGRLLPSCSYVRCTNISGTSEQSLATLLCSGCRRARYCSVACQRAAWMGGGHSHVCGSGGWAWAVSVT